MVARQVTVRAWRVDLCLDLDAQMEAGTCAPWEHLRHSGQYVRGDRKGDAGARYRGYMCDYRNAVCPLFCPELRRGAGRRKKEWIYQQGWAQGATTAPAVRQHCQVVSRSYIPWPHTLGRREYIRVSWTRDVSSATAQFRSRWSRNYMEVLDGFEKYVKEFRGAVGR